MAAVIEQRKSTGAGSETLDRAAICVSAVCLVQCLLLPLLLLFGPLTALGLFSHEAFHLVMLAIVAPLSAAAFFLGFRVHRNRAMLVPGMTGLAVVALAALLEGAVLTINQAALLTSLGGVFLIIGHWLNLRRRRQLRPQPGD